MKLIASILLFMCIGTLAQAAAIVKVEYKVDDKLVGLMVYTGAGGWSDQKFWDLMTRSPERSYDVKIEPNEKGGKVATLKGNVSVYMQARNSVDIGTAKAEQVTLKRDKAGSNDWYLSKEEAARLAKLAGVK